MNASREKVDNLNSSSISKSQRFKFSCKECSKVFKTKSGLNLHLKCHRPEKYLIKCNYCAFTTFQKSNFSKHIAVKHKRNLEGQCILEQFTCYICQYRCVLEDQLKAHIVRKHTNTSDKKFKCQQCEYGSVEKADLNKHIRICHTNQRPYSCDTCSFRAHTASGMARHRRSHSRIQPYKCPICFLCYADKKRLKEHIMKHSNEKPFSCHSCKYSTNRRDNLKLHVKRNHSEPSVVTSIGIHTISDIEGLSTNSVISLSHHSS